MPRVADVLAESAETAGETVATVVEVVEAVEAVAIPGTPNKVSPDQTKDRCSTAPVFFLSLGEFVVTLSCYESF
jgi:hypothetical protein